MNYLVTIGQYVLEAVLFLLGAAALVFGPLAVR